MNGIIELLESFRIQTFDQSIKCLEPIEQDTSIVGDEVKPKKKVKEKGPRRTTKENVKKKYARPKRAYILNSKRSLVRYFHRNEKAIKKVISQSDQKTVKFGKTVWEIYFLLHFKMSTKLI